jgi:hypothetical protein
MLEIMRHEIDTITNQYIRKKVVSINQTEYDYGNVRQRSPKSKCYIIQKM